MKQQERLVEDISSAPMSPITKQLRQRTFKRYRKRLVWQVVLIVIVCFAIILQRIFYEIIVEMENDSIKSLQTSFSLSQKYTQQDGTVVYEPTGIVTGTAQAFYSSLGMFKVQFLILTHILLTIYVSVNALIASKLMFTTIIITYIISLLQLFYAGARPFWSDIQVFASSCLPSYDHPSRNVSIMAFFICYAFYCFSHSPEEENTEKKFDLRGFLIKIGIAVLFVVVQLLNYVLGEQYIISMCLGMVYSGSMLMVLVFIDSYVDTGVRKSTVMVMEAKKYSFYWLLYLTIAETFAMIVYNSQDYLLNIFWIQNFEKCIDYQKMNVAYLKYDEIIGPWFTFLQTSSIFALMGAIFGISYCFRSIKSLDWYRGPIKTRLLRALVANLLLIPSWLLIILVQNKRSSENTVQSLGLNEFILDAVHMFVLYLLLFGYMPIFILGKLLKLNFAGDEEYYVVMEEENKERM